MKLFVLMMVLFNLNGLVPLRAEEQPKNFEEEKARILKMIDMHLTKLTEHKTCVSQAANKEGLKACHEKVRMAPSEGFHPGPHDKPKK